MKIIGTILVSLAAGAAILIGLAFICRCLNFITFNLQFGERALDFFMELSETLTGNTMNVEYMPMPSYTASLILLIEQKRKEKVSNKQISEAIKANLTDFRWLAMFIMALKQRRQNKKTQEATAK